jgi:hypothetical protein
MTSPATVPTHETIATVAELIRSCPDAFTRNVLAIGLVESLHEDGAFFFEPDVLAACGFDSSVGFLCECSQCRRART